MHGCMEGSHFVQQKAFSQLEFGGKKLNAPLSYRLSTDRTGGQFKGCFLLCAMSEVMAPTEFLIVVIVAQLQ